MSENTTLFAANAGAKLPDVPVASRAAGLPSAAPNVPHPGHFIREELGARGWSQRDLAFVLGIPEHAVSQIVSGKRGISPDMAKALGDAFNVDHDFFANLQKAFDWAIG